MKKQGFTLIELMVVIVIMGVLAAVAVPKLFGMIAKAKASEVSTAAGVWIDLQDAYVTEKNSLGDWGQVGYSAPGVKVVNTSNQFSSKEFYYTGAVGTWIAGNVHKLNDCAAEANVSTATHWTLTGQTPLEGKWTIVAGGDAGCRALTPSFDALARTTAQ